MMLCLQGKPEWFSVTLQQWLIWGLRTKEWLNDSYSLLKAVGNSNARNKFFFLLDKEACKKAKMVVTLITRLLIGIIFMQVLGGAYSSRKVQQHCCYFTICWIANSEQERGCMNAKQKSGQYFMCSDKVLPEICLRATWRTLSDIHCKEAFSSIQKTGNMKYLTD